MESNYFYLFDKYKPNNYSKKRHTPTHKSSNLPEEEMEKMMTPSLPEEEEVFACLSFRNLALGSNLRSSSSTTSSSSSSDGDLDFEFLPSANNRASSFYPIFSGIGDGKRGEEIPESKVKVEEEEEEEEEEEITPWNTNCLWSKEKKRGRRREGIIEKCRSTGSGSSRPWRLRDLVVIGRSRSDGNEKLLLQSPTRTTKTTTNKKDGREDRRRTTFLPYRSEVVSLFPARRILPRRKSHY